MSYTRTIESVGGGGQSSLVVSELANSHSSLTVTSSAGQTVTVTNVLTGAVSFSPSLGFNTVILTATQDVQWGDSGGTFIVPDHPITTQEVIQVETNKQSIIDFHENDAADKIVLDAMASAVTANTAKVTNVAHPVVQTAVPAGALFTDTVYDDSALQTAVTANSAKVSNIAHPIVQTAVPVGAVFTDTIYDDSGLQTAVTANSAKVSNISHPIVQTAVPVGALFTDTVYDSTANDAAVAINTAKANIKTLGAGLALDGAGELTITSGPVSDDLKEDKVSKGVANGYAGLDASGIVPTSQLPAITPSDALTQAEVDHLGNIAVDHRLTVKLVEALSPTISDGDVWYEIDHSLSIKPLIGNKEDFSLRYNRKAGEGYPSVISSFWVNVSTYRKSDDVTGWKEFGEIKGAVDGQVKTMAWMDVTGPDHTVYKDDKCFINVQLLAFVNGVTYTKEYDIVILALGGGKFTVTANTKQFSLADIDLAPANTGIWR